MPYKVAKGHGCPDSKPWACINSDTGKVHGCHPSREAALKQSAALYANTDDEKSSHLPGAGQPGMPDGLPGPWLDSKLPGEGMDGIAPGLPGPGYTDDGVKDHVFEDGYCSNCGY